MEFEVVVVCSPLDLASQEVESAVGVPAAVPGVGGEETQSIGPAGMAREAGSEHREIGETRRFVERRTEPDRIEIDEKDLVAIGPNEEVAGMEIAVQHAGCVHLGDESAQGGGERSALAVGAKLVQGDDIVEGPRDEVAFADAEDAGLRTPAERHRRRHAATRELTHPLELEASLRSPQTLPQPGGAIGKMMLLHIDVETRQPNPIDGPLRTPLHDFGDTGREPGRDRIRVGRPDGGEFVGEMPLDHGRQMVRGVGGEGKAKDEG